MSIDFHDGVLLVSAYYLLFINIKFCVFSFLCPPSPAGVLVRFGPLTLLIFLHVILSVGICFVFLDSGG